MKPISELIEKYGKAKTRAYLLYFFENENNLRFFASLFPSHIESPLPEYQRELYNAIPIATRLGVAAPRGSGKSTSVNVVVLAYYTLFNKSPFSILLSDTLPQARLHLEALAHELEVNEAVNFLFGTVKGEVWGSDSILIKTQYGESLIIARGAGQKIRGLKFREHRPHLVVIDDLENDELVESDDRRIKLENWFRFNLLRGLSKEWSKVIMLGTILHENALLKKIVDGREPFQGWSRRIYKAIKDDGTSFWEKRFPILELIASRDDPSHPDYMGSIVFAQEMQGEPRSDKDRIIQESWIQEYSYQNKVTQEWLDSLTVFGGADPAISEKEGSSYFVFTTVGVDKDGHIWHLKTVRGKFTALEQVNIILDGYAEFGHDKISIESIAYQKVLSQLVKVEGGKRKVYPKIKEIFTDKDKTRRMVAISPQFEGKFIHLNSDDAETENLKKEILTFPAAPNDSADSFMLTLEGIAKPKARAFTRKPRIFGR